MYARAARRARLLYALRAGSIRQSVRLQGGAKFPTGGMQIALPGASLRARERLRRCCRVSRSGEKPEPTDTVRMEEDVQIVI